MAGGARLREVSSETLRQLSNGSRLKKAFSWSGALQNKQTGDRDALGDGKRENGDAPDDDKRIQAAANVDGVQQKETEGQQTIAEDAATENSAFLADAESEKDSECREDMLSISQFINSP